MEQITTESKKEVWQTIFIFLITVTILSSIFHYAIGNYSGSRASHDLRQVGKDIQITLFERIND
jgi:hypothetical protein